MKPYTHRTDVSNQIIRYWINQIYYFFDVRSNWNDPSGLRFIRDDKPQFNWHSVIQSLADGQLATTDLRDLLLEIDWNEPDVDLFEGDWSIGAEPMDSEIGQQRLPVTVQIHLKMN